MLFRSNIHAEWVKRPIPLYVAAEGPRTLELTGELADGVMCGMGLTPEALGASLDYLRTGASQSGRSLADLDVWAFARINIGDDKDALVREIRMELASTAHHAFRFTLEGKGVPEEMKARILEVQRGYNPRRHEALGESPNARLMADPELLAYMAERFAIVGNVEQCVEQIRRLEAAGVDGVLFTGFVEQRAELIRNIGKVIAEVRR